MIPEKGRAMKGDARVRRLFLPVIFCSTMVWAVGPRGPNYEGVRSMGMGNTTVSVTTDRTAIFHNPAGLGLLKDKVDISLTPFMMSVDGKLVTILNAILKQGGKLSNLSNIDSNFINTLSDIDGYWVGADYTPEFTVAKKNLGFGCYATWPVGVRVETGHFIPKLALRGTRDMVFTWAVGVPLKHENNHFGISIEYLQRTPLDERITTYTETFTLFEDIQSRPLGVLGDYAKVKHGASFDIGFMHDIKGLRIAWDVKDIFGIVGGELVFPPQVDLGCAYFFPMLEKVPAIRGFVIAGEIQDIIGFEQRTNRYEQFAKKVHFGTELDLKYVAFRAGINQGYPTAGIGFSFGLVNIDYVYFTQEMGYFAGQLPRSQHVLSIKLGIRVDDPDAQKKKNQAPEIHEEEPVITGPGQVTSPPTQH
jgi:hypothetical protein